MAAGPTEEIECRCDRRHPLGTEWCSCGAYLPHDGKIVAARSVPTTGAETGSAGVVERPAAVFEPPPRNDYFEPVDIDEASSPAFAMVTNAPATSPADAYEPGLEQHPTDGGSPFDDRVPRPDDLVCPSVTCHLRNDSTRTFCRRCGARLRSETTEDHDVMLPWWRRLWARITGRNPRRAAMNAQDRAYRVRGLTARARMVRSGAVVGLLAVSGLSLSPTIRTKAIDRVKDLAFADRYSFVNVSDVSTSSATVAGWEPELVDDGSYNRAWAAPWGVGFAGLEVAGEEAVCLDPGFPTLRLTLDQTSDVDRLRIWSGTWESDESRALRPRPKMLQVQPVTADGPGTCTFLPLEDTPEEQVAKVDLRDAVAVDVSIVGVYLGDGSSDLVAISELWLERKR
jgi:hypothetical protein